LKKQIVINASKDRSRIAIVEDGELVELYVENPDNVRTIGNIYLGRVQKVMPAIRAAFVDVGQKQDCFLHFSDLTDNFPQTLALAGEDVPGLDEPVLSLAPAKRVADDDDEPDIEDKLEVEPAEEESRSRRSRRSRGRGRGRRRGRREEEEEQEEADETPGRKRLPGVIDLTSPARPKRPARSDEGRPDDAGERTARKEDADETAEAPKGADADEAPPARASRRRGRKTTDTADGADDAQADAAPAGGDGPQDDAEQGDTEQDRGDESTDEPPRPKRRRGRRRGRRGRGGRDRQQKADDAPSADAAEKADSAEEKAPTSERRPSKRRPSKREGRTDEGPADAASEADEPKRLPASIDLTSGGGRPAGRPADERPAGDAGEEETTGKGADGEERSGRGRRRAPGRRRGEATETDGEEKDTSDRPRGRRGGRGRSEGGQKADEAGEKDRGGSRGRSSQRSSGGGSRQGGGARSAKLPPNDQLLKRDGRILVKITKEPISTKGPRVSTDLSLAGRFLVLVPAADYVAVSKKIESAKERKRLRTLAQSLKPDGFGVIVRTVAEGRDAKSLDQDLRLLSDKWRKIETKLARKPEPPVLLYEDVNMVSSVIRDLFSDDYDRILVDDEKVYRNVRAYVKAVAPQMADKVELHKGRSTAFRSVGIEKQVEEAFSKRVNMRGGGYLFIETTEAMHVIDVNSGRAGRGKSQKQNLIDVNVEAAREAAKQLRLRDLGGIIVIDFIDLRYDRDRKKVTDALKEAFKKDRAVTKLLPMSDFGLVQITRQRLRPSITTQAVDDDGEALVGAEAAAAAGAGEVRSARSEPEAPLLDDDDGGPADDGRDDRDRSGGRADGGRADGAAPDRPALAPEEATPEALAARLRGWLDRYRQLVDDRYKGRPIVVRVHPLLGAYLRRGFPSPLTRWRLALRGVPFRIEEDAAVDPLAFDVRDQKSGRPLLKKYA
jgi:ribonuclease G